MPPKPKLKPNAKPVTLFQSDDPANTGDDVVTYDEETQADHVPDLAASSSGLQKTIVSDENRVAKKYKREVLQAKLQVTALSRKKMALKGRSVITESEVTSFVEECMDLLDKLSHIQLEILEDTVDDEFLIQIESQIEHLEKEINRLILASESLLESTKPPICQQADMASLKVSRKTEQVVTGMGKIEVSAGCSRSDDAVSTDLRQRQGEPISPRPRSQVSSSPILPHQSHYLPIPQLHGQQLSLEKFDGDILKFFQFKKRFVRYIENSYGDYGCRMLYLEDHCVGKAREAISGLSCLDDSRTAYEMAWDRLEKRFGDPRRLLARVKEDLVEGPAVSEWDAEGLTKLCDKMYQCETSFASWDKVYLLNNEDLLQKLFRRLPYKLKDQFVAIANQGMECGTFTDLRILVENAASKADSEYGHLMQAEKQGRRPQQPLSNRAGISNIKRSGVCASLQVSETKQMVCPLCQSGHNLWECEDFRKRSVKERNDFVKRERLCFNCLKHGHRVFECKFKAKCRICAKGHNTLLHFDRRVLNEEALSINGDAPKEGSRRVVACSAPAKLPGNIEPTIFKVVPVKVWANDPTNCISTYAFIDEGSSVNMCSASLAARLGVNVTDSSIELLTANAISLQRKKVDFLSIQGVEEQVAFSVRDALVMDKIVDVSSSIPTNSLARTYPHLEDLHFPKLEENKVDLLLGSDLHQAYLLQEIRTGKPGEPSGLHTSLGWTIYGKDDGDRMIEGTSQMMVNFVDTVRPVKESCEDILNLMAQDFHDLHEPQVLCPSIEDQQAVRRMEQSCKKMDNHYSVGLLWKDDNLNLLNNRSLALKRLEGLQKRFLADPKLFTKYNEKITEYINCGYAERLPENVTSPEGRTCYIPHHCTSVHTKFRVVFDCSAKFQGVSLNDLLLNGPDLTNNLVGTLLRFRQFPIAIVGDIKAMFSQVFVDKPDQDALRFLWFKDNDPHQPPVDYRMKTHVFGAKSSPTCAAFALRKTAEENLPGMSNETVKTVLNNIYVDDLCKSCDDVSKAVRLIAELRELLASGGFHITKFLSNESQVIKSLPSEVLASSVDPGCCQLPTQKTLGVYWDAASDRMKVRVNINQRSCTRRGLLSMVSQVFDPLGLLSPFILPVRQLLQDVCRREVDWDFDLTSIPEVGRDWGKWMQASPELECLSLARSLTLQAKKVSSYELHTFSDASTSGYGICSYLRVIYCDSTVQCCFVFGKSRVAPIKCVSVPRLELAAAVLAAKSSAFILREFELCIDSAFLWTDASVVLRYIRNTSTRFTTFVANRLQTIHSLSSVKQWHYVPSVENPADLASRGIWPNKLNDSVIDMWLNGPSFLLAHRIDWPKQPDFITDCFENDAEVKELCSAQVSTPVADPLHRLFTRYSSFNSLQRTVAWLRRFWQFLKHRVRGHACPTSLIDAEEMEAARLAIVRSIQVQTFPEVFSVLHDHESFDTPMNMIKQQQILKNPSLRLLQSLNPYVVNGILRVGGRLQKSTLPSEGKHPAILPNNHPVTDLLVMLTHVHEGHMGSSQVLATMNSQYWILKGRTAVNRVLKSCLNCRFWRATAGKQQMGNLPADRVTRGTAFKATGTDLLGPLFIKVGRNCIKRYICIFNCLSTRAVHFEVVQSLEASAFLQAFRRFCNRRNVCPTDVYSDNGGNFVAAERELKQGLKNWRCKQVHDALLKEQINWHFIPPRASHQAGFYEAFFRLFRKLMRSLVGEVTLDEFDMLTLVTEIERILNDRPITKLPSSPDDLAALTPSMIVTGSTCTDFPPDVFLKADGYKRSWRKTQFVADKFWDQWMVQYLPLLQPRQKWFAASPSIKPGDLVLVMDESTKRGQWPKAIVVEVMPDASKLVRRVRVRTADGTILYRDIRKICLLEGCLD